MVALADRTKHFLCLGTRLSLRWILTETFTKSEVLQTHWRAVLELQKVPLQGFLLVFRSGLSPRFLATLTMNNRAIRIPI